MQVLFQPPPRSRPRLASDRIFAAYVPVSQAAIIKRSTRPARSTAPISFSRARGTTLSRPRVSLSITGWTLDWLHRRSRTKQQSIFT